MKTQNKIFIYLGVFLLIDTLLIVFLVWPFIQDIKNNSEKIVFLQNKLFILQNQSTEINNFSKKYEEYKPNLEKIDTLFVDSKNPVSFIEFLEKISSDSGVNSTVNLQSDIQNEKSSKSKSFINFQINCDGNFLKVLKFSEMLENSPYLIQIDNVTIRKLTETKGINYSLENVQAIFIIKVSAK